MDLFYCGSLDVVANASARTSGCLIVMMGKIHNQLERGERRGSYLHICMYSTATNERKNE